MAKNITDVRTSKDLDVELILKLKPDVVIATLSDKLRLSMHLVHSYLGYYLTKQRVLEVLRWYKSRLDLIEQRLKQIRHRVKVYIETG